VTRGVQELRRQRNDIMRGRFMYPRETAARMVRLVRAGLIDLTHFDLIEFRLDDGNEAVAHAAANASPFQLTALLRTGVAA
jgi:alcohol dehydrogenase